MGRGHIVASGFSVWWLPRWRCSAHGAMEEWHVRWTLVFVGLPKLRRAHIAVPRVSREQRAVLGRGLPWQERARAEGRGQHGMIQAQARGRAARAVEKELRMCRRALEPEQAKAILARLGIRGEVVQCWVDCRPGKLRRHAVLAATGERWPGTRVPVERVFYLRPEGEGWALDGSCRVIPSEWYELEGAEDQARPRRSKRGDAGRGLAELVEEALAAAGL